MELHGWTVVDAERAVLWREYQFSKGAWATTLVFRGVDGLVVVSPGNGLAAADYHALGEFGQVRALVASNGMHHLGHAPWRACFPTAESYAAPTALPGLARKAAGVPFRPLEQLALPAGVKLHVLPGFKTGEVLASVATGRGALWYTGDLLTNIQRTPGPPLSWLFRLSGSAPGFRLFKLGVFFSVNDRRALRDRLAALLADDPPALVVPGHGPAVATGEVASQVRAQIELL